MAEHNCVKNGSSGNTLNVDLIVSVFPHFHFCCLSFSRLPLIYKKTVCQNISKSSYLNKLSGPTVPKYWTPRATLGVRKQKNKDDSYSED